MAPAKRLGPNDNEWGTERSNLADSVSDQLVHLKKQWVLTLHGVALFINIIGSAVQEADVILLRLHFKLDASLDELSIDVATLAKSVDARIHLIDEIYRHEHFI